MADDSAGAGALHALREWWDSLCSAGADYGYNTNSLKTVLLVKADLLEEAVAIFEGTGVRITLEGVRYLGSAVGEPAFLERFFLDKVEEWKREIQKLATFAVTEPHAAFAALTHGLHGKYTYLLRTLPAPVEGLDDLDNAIVQWLLPALTGRAKFSDAELELLRLPARLGGMGLPHLRAVAADHLAGSREMTKGQVNEIFMQNCQHDTPTVNTLHREAESARNRMKNRRRKAEAVRCKNLIRTWPTQQSQIEHLSEKGSSSWLTALPLKEHGFWLSKQDFRDAVALRYSWQLENTPLTCVCGKDFSADHAMTCTFGGFPTIRHNEVRDIVGTLLSEVCNNVAMEPKLKPLSGEVFQARSTTTSPEARSDVRATGFWTRMEDAFFDIRIFNQNATSNRNKTFVEASEHHERLKQLEYEERIINVDHGSFCPLVFSTSGAAGRLATRFLKRLAGKIAEKDNEEYSAVMAWIRCKLSFALLRSAVMCVRGSRSSRHSPVLENRQVSIVEGCLPIDDR